MQNKIIKGAFILTIATIITRLLGFVYRVYMTNIIGALGMGLYQLIMPVSMLVWSICSAGFSTTISKLVAEENAKKEHGNIKRILKISSFFSIFLAILCSIFIFIFSNYIVNNIFKDDRILLSLHIMCISFPFMAYGSCIRGYFLGMQKTLIPAISQVLEQIVKMTSIYFLSSLFIPLGLSYACALGVLGMCLGEIFSFLYVYLLYNRDNLQKNKKATKNISKYCTIILAMALPLTSNRILGSFFVTLENILIPQKLIQYGYNNLQALSILGKLNGMAIPILMFPSSFLSSIAIALVPAISEAISQKNTVFIKNNISKIFLFTSIISFIAAGALFTFPLEIGNVIYSQDIKIYLIYLSAICPFLYYHLVFSGILNGLGLQMFILKNSLFSSVISLIFIYFFVPLYGVIAFILGWLLSLIIVDITALLKLKKLIDFKFDIINYIFKPAICITASCILIRLLYNYLVYFYSSIISLIICLAILTIIYIFLLIITECINFKTFKGILKLK